MKDYQREFFDFAIAAGAVRFGEFTLKSGRISPYFFNAGRFSSGGRLARLGRFYARAVVDAGLEFDMIFGPAYKGIPLAAAVAIALAEHHGRDLPYAFNRKEAKDHGEGGAIVGAPLQGRVLVVDDVISSGLSIRESIGFITAAGARPAGLLIALDRQERGQGPGSAAREVESAFHIPVLSIVRLDTLLDYLAQREDVREHLHAVRAYSQTYGTS